MVIAQRQVDKKSNEITAFKPLLEPLNLEGNLQAPEPDSKPPGHRA